MLDNSDNTMIYRKRDGYVQERFQTCALLMQLHVGRSSTEGSVGGECCNIKTRVKSAERNSSKARVKRLHARNEDELCPGHVLHAQASIQM